MEEYKRLTLKLLDGRAGGTLNEEEEDELLDQLDNVWNRLTKKQTEEISVWLKTIRR